jgi:hypothetical protein
VFFNNSVGRYWCFRDDEVHFNQSVTCHSGIRNNRNVNSFVTAIGAHPLFNKFWEYLTSPNGVYAALFRIPGWELLTYDGVVVALTIPDEVFQSTDFPYCLLYSFLIDSRMFHERKEFLEVWDCLVCQGIDPKLSYIMAVHFQFGVDNFKSLLPSGYYKWRGNHQVFNDMYSNTNFNVYLKGMYYTAGDFVPTSKLWREGQDSSTYYCRGLESQIEWEKFGKKISVGSFGKDFSYEIPLTNMIPLSEHFLEVIKRKDNVKS